MTTLKRYIRPVLMVLFAISLLFVQKLTFSGQAAYKVFIDNLGLSTINITVLLPMLATACLLLLFILPDEESKPASQVENP
ncbi:hypothetical protein GCM10023189_57110 [Nibrella saemangeumensis]|uniref:Uncharacterized protein n=1 Tax=Nibrella saemangeumensis TaxID=1084526 RepID=A0ABP8NR29_9BACT